MELAEIKQAVKRDLVHWELVPNGKKPVNEKMFRVRLIGTKIEKVARIKNGKAEIISG